MNQQLERIGKNPHMDEPKIMGEVNHRSAKRKEKRDNPVSILRILRHLADRSSKETRSKFPGSSTDNVRGKGSEVKSKEKLEFSNWKHSSICIAKESGGKTESF